MPVLFIIGTLPWYVIGKIRRHWKKNYIVQIHLSSINNSNITSFFRFVDKRAIYRWYNLIRTWVGGYLISKLYPSPLARDKILISANPC
jgi:hypothetical protein